VVLECFRLGTSAKRKALILVCCAFKFVQIGGNTKNSACDRIEILDLYIRGGERKTEPPLPKPAEMVPFRPCCQAQADEICFGKQSARPYYEQHFCALGPKHLQALKV
jgi:hypothetical protein